MPGKPHALIADAERRFPLRIALKVPPCGFGQQYDGMCRWLDENCGAAAWSITPAGSRGIANDAVAVYMPGPACAVGFVARWCVPGDPPGFYELRRDHPARREPGRSPKAPPG